MNDITWGRDAEQWPRDYTLFSRRLQFLRFNFVPVRIFSQNGISLTCYIVKFNVDEKAIYVSDIPRSKDRIRLELQNIATLEELPDRNQNTMTLLNGEAFNKRVSVASKKDFFSICNKCFKQGVEIRVYMMDGRIIEGKTTGVNACQTGVIKANGNHVQVLFDWVTRITSVDFSWNQKIY
ncbi:phase 1 flagellin transcriptional repressor [Salmonella enterica]|nr:phase 1 flagellin transcriptional repressor [Salmonella enterica]